MDGLSRSDSLSGRGGRRSMIVGSSFSDFVFNSLWWNPVHRSRVRTLLSRNSVPSLSLINGLLARRYSTFQSHRTFQVLIKPLLVIVR